MERLRDLWEVRAKGGHAADFEIGPGDVLEISVPGLPELESRTVRVSGDGMISLPLIGGIKAAGRTETEVRDEIQRLLEEGVMRRPPVTLFVKDYRSRVAGVIGAVRMPGFYTVASESDTILDMIALAGGMTNEAAPKVHLIPASRGAASVAASLFPDSATGRGPIVIDLMSLRAGGSVEYLDLPTRPGDVIVVPERGAVLVEGYVKRPGAYSISPGLGVLGAVAAASGPEFASDTAEVWLIRPAEDGIKVTHTLDLERIQRGEQSDIPVRPGDIVRVPSSFPKLAVSRVLNFVARIFSVGVR